MNVVLYALACYGLTALISLAAIAVVLGVNSVMNNFDDDSLD